MQGIEIPQAALLQPTNTAELAFALALALEPEESFSGAGKGGATSRFRFAVGEPLNPYLIN